VSTIKYTEKFKISQPIEILFPLFSAEGEKVWVPGWDYENIIGSTDLYENHDHASTDAIWLVKKHEPESYLVQFYKVEPEDKVGIITVQCIKIDDSQTQVEVSYEYIGLSRKGDEFIERFTSSEYKEFINEWNTLLDTYFESKC